MKLSRLFSCIALLCAGAFVMPLAAQAPISTPASVVLSAPANSTTAQTQEITVTGTPGSSWRVQAVGGFWLRFRVTPTCPAAVNDCTTSTAGSTTITIVADPTNLLAYLYTGYLTISYGPESAITIPVSLNVGGGANAAALIATPNTLSFAGAPGGAPQNRTLALSSVNASSPIYLSATSSAPWLTTSLAGSSTFEPATVTVTADPSQLTAGTYTGNLTFSPSAAAAPPVVVVVTFVVSQAQQLVVNPTAVNFSAFPGGSGLSPVSVSIGVSTGANVPYTASVSYSGIAAMTWLKTNVPSGQTGTNLVISAAASNLPAGNYVGYVNIASPGLAPVSIPVSLTISNTPRAPALVSDINPISISVQPNTAGSRSFVISSSTGAAIPYSVALQYANPQNPAVNWISLLGATGTTPGGVTLTASPGTLPVGTYTANLLVTSTTAGFAPLTIPVTLTVSTNQMITFLPTNLTFTSYLNGSSSDQNLTINTSTGISTPFTLSSNVPWISILNPSASTPGSAIIRANPAGLAVGVYTGNLTVSSPGASNNGATVPVTLTVTGASQPPTLSPTILSFVAQTGGAAPASRTVSISSTGAVYSVTSNQNWLQATPSGGNTPGAFSVSVNPTGLAAGNYSGNLAVTSAGTTLNLPILLEVTAGPFLQLSQSSVAFNYQTGQTLPLPRTVFVNASNGATLAASVSSLSSEGNWLVVTPTTLQTPGAFTLNVAPNIVAAMSPGTYAGTVVVTANGALNATVNVTLTISAAGLLTMSTTPATFNAEVNGFTPPAQTRQITATSGLLAVTSSVATASGANWLSASLSSNVTPSTLTINASAAGLSAGVYKGAVTVSTSNSGGALVVPVTLTVGTQVSLSVDKSEVIFSGASVSTPQTIQVNSTSGNLSYAVSVNQLNSNTNWLNVGTTSGVTPSTVTLTPNPSLLPDGVYLATVTITPLSTGGSPLTVPVTLVVNQASALQVTPTTLNFTQVRGAGLATTQTVQVTSLQPVPFTFTTSIQSPAGTNWLSVSQSGALTNGNLQVALNSTAATLPIGNYTATVTVSGPNSQTSVPITVNLSVVSIGTLIVTPSGVNFSGRFGQANPPAQTVQVASSLPGSPVAFNVTSDAPWLSATPLTSTTPSALTISVNTSAIPAGNTLTVGHLTLVPVTGGQTATISVSFIAEATPAPAVAAVANSATYQPGSLSPGMLFSIFGTNLGPTQGVLGEVSGGRFTTSVGGVRVLFDGIPAPILYAGATQINAAVPYQLAGRAFASMTVEVNGVTSPAVAPRLVDTAPGIFTTDTHQAAALNADGTVNSPSNPAKAGSIVVLYVTGEGQTTPGGVDGEVVPATNLKKPLGAVRVRVNGTDVPASDIVYAGSAPSLVSGLMQINFKLPANAPANNATPVDIFVGAGQSPAGTTIAVSQ